MKDNQEVIKEFNELVNMTASELEKWLKSDDSNSAGWPKETEGGETVGHDSGRKIVEILNDNPKKDPKKYTEDQVTHMRKVVAYCKRHLAQETKGNNEKSAEEVKKTKSYASLKNWGHDFLKAQGKTDGKETKEDEEVEDGTGDDKAGDKRKTTAAQSGSNKKQQTQKGQATKKDEDEAEDEDEDENETKTRSKTKKDDEDEEMEEAEDNQEEEDEDEDQEDDENQTKRQTRSSKKSNGQATNGKATKSNNKSTKNENDDNDDKEDKEEKANGGQTGSPPKKGPKKGDTVSWSWGSGNPEGKVLDVKAEETTITTKKGNKVTRKGDEEDPAVVLDAGSSKAIKLNHELN